MSQLSGTTGYVKLGATTYAFDKWKIAMRGGAPKVTNFTGGGYQQLVAGVVAGTVTLSGPFNSGSMALAVGTSYAFVLGMTTGVELTVTALVTGIDVEDAVEDAPRITVTAESTGTFTASVA